MGHIFVELISQMTQLSKEEELFIEDTFPIETFKKGTYLLKQGQIAKGSFFIIKGCVREYLLEDGEEKTIAFYTEQQSLANQSSISNQTPSKINFVCSEDTTVVITLTEKEKKLYEKFPRFKEFCLEEMDRIIGEQREKLTEFYRLKPEERYVKLQEERPDLLNRVPQYQIASYLGIKPETLSRIRARMVNNK